MRTINESVVTETVELQIEQMTAQYLENSEADLEATLGAILQQNEQGLHAPISAGGVAPSIHFIAATDSHASHDELRALAAKFWARFDRSLYSLLCDRNDPDNQKIKELAELSVQGLAAALALQLAVDFAWIPTIAAIVAAILAKRIARAGYETLCDTWKGAFPAT